MKKDKKHIEYLKEYIKSAESRAKYSIERFDILIISLSSGGIALSVGFYDKFESVNKNSVFYGCLFFAISLIINLLSQVTGYYANRNDIKYSKEEIRELEKKQFKKDYQKYDCYKRIFDFLTNLFNGFSLLGLIVGIVFILSFIKNLNI